MSRRIVSALAVLLGVTVPLHATAATFVPDTYIGSQLGRFSYSGKWEHVSGMRDGRDSGTSSRTAERGASVSLIFLGESVRVYGVRGPGGGHGGVMLDKERLALVDFYAPQKSTQRIVYSSVKLPRGVHTLTIFALADKRDAAHRSSYVNISGASFE